MICGTAILPPVRFFISAAVFLEKVTKCVSNSIPRDCRSALASLQGAQNKAVYISTLLSGVMTTFSIAVLSLGRIKQNGIKIKNMPFQKGDVIKTHSDTKKIDKIINFKKTAVERGVENFIKWYKEYYSIK